MRPGNSRQYTKELHLRDRGCKHYDLIELAHSLHELIDTRPLDNINVVILPFNLHWNREISLMEYLQSSVL